MKKLITHLLCFLAGLFFAALIFLFMASLGSLVWQNDIKIKSAYLLQLDGAKAAKKGDWSLTQHFFQASDNIELHIRPISWDFSYPLHGWRYMGLVEYPDKTFLLRNLAIEAYALQKQGKTVEANQIYATLSSAYPSKDRAYFETVAKQTLLAFSDANSDKKSK